MKGREEEVYGEVEEERKGGKWMTKEECHGGGTEPGTR